MGIRRPGTPLHTLGDPTDWVYCVAWSPDKKHLSPVESTGRLACGQPIEMEVSWSIPYTLTRRPFGESPTRMAAPTVFTAGEDRIIKAWKTCSTCRKRKSLANNLKRSSSPVGKQLAVSSMAWRTSGHGNGSKTTNSFLPSRRRQNRRSSCRRSPDRKTTTLTVTGKDLDTASDVNTSRPEVKFQIVERAPVHLRYSAYATQGGSDRLDLE